MHLHSIFANLQICKFANMDLVISELTPGGASRVNLSIFQLWIDVGSLEWGVP